MSKRTPKNPKKLTQHPCCTMLILGKNLKSRRCNGYRFVQKGETFPTETIMLVVREALVCEKLIPKPGPNGTMFFYPNILMPFHDSMPMFMNFRRVLYLLELQKQAPQHLSESHGAVVFEIQPHFLNGT